MLLREINIFKKVLKTQFLTKLDALNMMSQKKCNENVSYIVKSKLKISN